MDRLRIGLIIGGLIVLAGIYFWERRPKKKRRDGRPVNLPAPSGEPVAGENPDLAEDPDLAASADPVVDTGADNAGVAKIADYVVMYVNAPVGHFKGPVIRVALLAYGLVFNDIHKYFEYPDKQTGHIDFYVTNMVNPGVFPDANLKDFHTVGLAFIMPLPAGGDSSGKLDTMIQVATRVSGQLNGRLLDQEHHILTKHSMELMRDKVTASAKSWPKSHTG